MRARSVRACRLALASATVMTVVVVATPAGAAPDVTLVTNKGTIVLTLDKRKAPKTVANFVRYVRSGHYDGTIFHRVIPNFMIQGGGFTTRYQKKPTRAPVQNEADNGLRNRRGTVVMARTSDPHSASAQFFINIKDNGFLDHTAKTSRGWGYAVFGRVKSGMDVVTSIVNVSTGARGPFGKDAPLSNIVIERACVGRCSKRKKGR